MKKVLLLALAALSVAGANGMSNGIKGNPNSRIGVLNTQGWIYKYNYGSAACNALIAQHTAAVAAQNRCASASAAAAKAGKGGFGCAIYVPLVPTSCLAQ